MTARAISAAAWARLFPVPDSGPDGVERPALGMTYRPPYGREWTYTTDVRGDGAPLTGCHGATTTFHDATLCCRVCYRRVLT